MNADAGLEEVLRASRNPSALASCVAIGLTWLGIVATLMVAAEVNHFVMIVPLLLVLGALQHRLFTIYHEAFHRTLFASREVNDFAGRWLAAYPTLSRYDEVRSRHLAHHRWTATADDPEYLSYPQTWREFLPLIFPWPSLVLRHVRSIFRESRDSPSSGQAMRSLWELIKVCLTQAVILAVGILLGFGWWILLYWGAVTLVLPVLTGIRQFVEHRPDKNVAGDHRYVVTQASRIERFFFSPMNFNLHEAHHRFPYVSFCWLPAVQNHLLKVGSTGVIHQSYCSVLFRNLRW